MSITWNYPVLLENLDNDNVLKNEIVVALVLFLRNVLRRFEKALANIRCS